MRSNYWLMSHEVSEALRLFGAERASKLLTRLKKTDLIIERFTKLCSVRTKVLYDRLAHVVSLRLSFSRVRLRSSEPPGSAGIGGTRVVVKVIPSVSGSFF